MMSTSDAAYEKFKNQGKPLLIFGNIIIICVMVLMCLSFVFSQKIAGEQKAEESFFTTVKAVQKVLRGYILSQQQSCNDWAIYINSQSMTIDEALDYLIESNSSEGVMGQIIDYDTMKGVSTAADYRGDNTVDYSAHTEYFDFMLDDVKEGGIQENKAYPTKTFTNPIDSMPTIGFCQDIKLTQADGSVKSYLLVRSVLLSLLEDRWVFPSGYEDAEMSIITTDGGYIMRSESLRQDNFWEFLRIYNNLSYDDSAVLKNELCTGGKMTRLLNSEREKSYYVVLRASVSSDVFYVGYVPKDSIVNTKVDFYMVKVVIIGVLLMLIINGTYILYINRKLNESVAETKFANEAKTRFLSSMSHDIRTPMNAIVGMTTIAAKHMDDPVQVKECLGKITLASNHLLTLINDVLDISRVESGKLTLNPMVFSLSEIVSNLVNIVSPQVKEKGLEFNVRIHEIEREYLYADELRINQIFINLLSNAVKYTNAGGSVTIDIAETTDNAPKGSVMLTYIVEDTGIGMSKEFTERMYKTFVRAVDTRIDKIQGSGLGLAITKQMVDLMGGTIECESELGKGTKFTVTLELPIAEKTTDDLVLPPLSVLLVDDDEIFLTTAEDTLRSMGVTVDMANNGQKAVEMVMKRHEAGNDYPVVIVDLRMPGMNGVETTQAIRQKVGNDVPIIIISSYDWTEIEDEALAAGANAFINKPLFKSTFYNKMNDLLHFDKNTADETSDEDFSDLDGLNLLIAEDNDLNWEIIEEILSYYNIKSERAVNGQICVDMINRKKAGTYDAVLMDIQMPVMNGRDAARAIRKMSEEAKRSIPIIAMTADAFSEDVAASLNAGMNSHVSKPIDIKKLFVALRESGLGNSN